MDVTILIFLLVYAAMGLGKLPGFKVDRTGAAVVGALAMMIAGSIAPQAAWNAIDYKTVGMLFGLMVVSAAFVVSGLLRLGGAACDSAQGRRQPCLPS
jgi:Na+/H+ antiporter NhaD/arsenite permease-like protein